MLSNPLLYNILGEILKNPNVSINQIAQDLQLFPNAIQYHLRKFQEENLMQIEICGHKKQKFNINLLL